MGIIGFQTAIWIAIAGHLYTKVDDMGKHIYTHVHEVPSSKAILECYKGER